MSVLLINERLFPYRRYVSGSPKVYWTILEINRRNNKVKYKIRDREDYPVFPIHRLDELDAKFGLSFGN